MSAVQDEVMTKTHTLHFIAPGEVSVVVAAPIADVFFRRDIWVHFANTDAKKGELQLLTDRKNLRRRLQDEGEWRYRHYGCDAIEGVPTTAGVLWPGGCSAFALPCFSAFLLCASSFAFSRSWSSLVLSSARSTDT